MNTPTPPSPPSSPGHPLQSELALQDPQTLSVLLVDDHSIVRNGLREILAAKWPGTRIGEAQDATEALKQVAQGPWTLVLLDVSLPGQSGLEVLKQMKALRPEIKILMFTVHPENQYALRALKAGAAGYLTKESPVPTIVEAVHKVLQGGSFVSPSLAEMLVAGLNGPQAKAPHEGLSDREYQVLRMLGLGQSVKEIGFALSLSVKTVSTYRIRVLKKLGLKTNADIIRYALREKLVE